MENMNNCVDGIVLSIIEYKENDCILHVLSREYGKVSLLARGIKKMTSKNASACHLFACSTFTFAYQDKDHLHLLKTAEKKQLFHHIYDDLLSQSVAQVLVEAVDKVEFDNSTEVYLLLHSMLTYLHERQNPYTILGFMLAKLNMMNGVSPNVEQCIYCKKDTSIVSISIYDGGFVCSSCFDSHVHQAKELSQLQFFRLLHKAQIEDVPTLCNWKEATYEDIECVVSMFLEHSGIALKSIAFLEKIKDFKKD